MRKEIHFKIHCILLYVFAFAMPFSTPSLNYSFEGMHFYLNITPTLLGLFLLNWLVEADFKAKLQRIKENKLIFPFLAVTGFYAMYLIGMTYTANLDFGRTDLLLKLPFLLFPLLIFTTNSKLWKPKMTQNLLFTFAAGNLLALFISLIHSAIRSEGTFSIYYFHYGNASLFYHPSYASMYYCFSFVIIFYVLINNQLSSWKKIIAWFMFLLFPMGIALLDSRTGLLAFAATIVMFAFYIVIFNRKKSLRFFLYMSVLFCIFGAIYLLLPKEINRLFVSIYQMKVENIKVENINVENINVEELNEDVRLGKIDARAQIWISAVEVIKEHPVLGVGTGDVKDALMEKYIQYNFYKSQEYRFNAHNQFLQIMVTFGLAGFAIFLTFLASIFWMSWKKRSVLLFAFGLIGLVNFWTESMFEKQIGVMFFAFFFALLCYGDMVNE